MFRKDRRFNQPYPGMGPGQFPGVGPGQVPGMGPGQMPGMGPGLMPGMGPGQMPGMGPGQFPSGEQAGMFPQLQSERLRQEIIENRRRLNNLARRVSRIENYLRIHETPDGGYFEDDSPQNYSF